MAVKIGSLLIRLAVEHGLLQEGLARSERDVAKTTKAIQRRGRDIADFGKQMSLAVSLPMAAIAKSAVDGFIEQQKAMADVTAALTSMGGASGKTADELAKTADALEMRSLFDAELILKQVTANLLTFGRIAGQEFDRAQQAALDLSARLGTDLTSSAVMIGKALNDPVKGITAMSRAGIQFTEDQKAMIAGMVETGNVAGAQRIILAELEKQFGGAAAAAADASPWRQAQVAIGQAMDAIGAAILPAIVPIGEAIAAMAGAFASLPAPVQQAVVVLGALAAIVGPISIGLGAVISAGASTIAMLGGFPAILSVVGLAMNTLLLSPLGLVVAAVAAVVAAWYYWDDIKAIVADVGRAVSGWWNDSVAPVLGSLEAGLGRAVTWWVTLQIGALGAIGKLVTGVREWLIDRLGPILDWVGKKTEQVSGFFRDMYVAVVGNSWVPDMVEGIRVEMAKLDAFMVDPARKAATATDAAMRGLAERVRGHLRDLFPEIEAAAAKAAQIADLFAGERAGLIGAGARRDAVRRAQGFDQGPLEEAAEVNAAAESIAASIGQVARTTQTQTVQVAESFRDMADRSIQALDRMVSAIKGGGFLDILGSAVNLFLQLGSTGLFGAGLAANINAPRIPGNANGTAFHPGGLMMVGERGPEILAAPRGSRVVPNHELRAANDSARVHVTVGIDPNTGNLTAFTDSRILSAAPAIASAGSGLAQAQMAQTARRRVR